MNLSEWIENAINDLARAGDTATVCDQGSPHGQTRPGRPVGTPALADRRDRPQRDATAEPRSNVIPFVPRGSTTPRTGTILPVLGAADGIG